MNIVFASHSPYDGYLIVGSHQLARELSAMGHCAWCIGPPITPLHFAMAFNTKYRDRLRKAFQPPYRLQGGTTVIEPLSVVPWQIARWTLRFGNSFVLSSNIASKLAKPDGPSPIDVLLIDDPRYVGLETLLKPRSVFYRPTDLYSEMKQDTKLITAERRLLAHCSGVIATSQPVMDHVKALRPGLPNLLLENGVDYQHFSVRCSEPEELKGIACPRIIYVGALDFRFDCEVLAYMADHLPEANFVIIGPGEKQESVRALQKSNIYCLGPKAYKSIPGFLQHSNIGILPVLDSLANSGRSPMILYEYGAAGLPVVSRRTPELTRRAEPFIRLFSSGEEAVENLRALLKAPPDRSTISESCRKHSWVAKAEALVKFIEMKEETNAWRDKH
jgi:glycosyltransferase involved in cell wall biosynthesis